MKKHIITFTILLIVSLSGNKLFAQNDLSDDEKDTTESGYDKWSIEIGVGNNKPITPFTSNQYYTGDPTNFVALADMKHYSIAVRRMLNTSFGLRLRANYDEYSNQKNSGSLKFKSEMIYADLEGVANLGQLLNFKSFSSRIGLLAHLGGYVGYFTPKNDGMYDKSEFNGGFVLGVSPMFRITNTVAFFIDLSSYTSFRQHYSWDGYSLQNASDGAKTHTMSQESKNLNSQLYTFSAGLKFYLGGNEQHADWYNETKAVADKSDKLGKRIDDIESRLQDTDRDGVVDYLDTEPNTVTGVTVDTKGRSIDRNTNGVPDELESKAGKDGADGVTAIEKQDAIKILVERGYVNVFFDVNMDDPNVGSTNNVYQIIHFLRSYPDAKAKLMGYADVRGDESKNQDLSTRRAQKVLDIIAASGVDASRLTIVGNGVDTSYPADTKIGLDLARRVSVVLE